MSEIVERLTEIRATRPEAIAETLDDRFTGYSAEDRAAAIDSGGSKRETEVR